jgi:hypothetical protein
MMLSEKFFGVPKFGWLQISLFVEEICVEEFQGYRAIRYGGIVGRHGSFVEVA